MSSAAIKCFMNIHQYGLVEFLGDFLFDDYLSSA